MGVLDDAIREHIELQRLHGASEEDLRRQEREALGPARRETPSQADEAPDADAEAPVAESVEGAGEAFDRQRTRVIHSMDETVEAPGGGNGQPDPEDFHEAPPAAAAFTGHEPFADDEPFAEPASIEGKQDLEDEGEEDEGEEDVLEETPEFLQETPEHDRLWFEQKPPRDFDFDDK